MNEAYDQLRNDRDRELQQLKQFHQEALDKVESKTSSFQQ